MAISNTANLTNNELYTAVRAYSKNFESMTANTSYEEFKNAILGGTDRATTVTLANNFLGTAIQWYLNTVHGQAAKDTFESQGFGEKYFSDFAGAMQNLYVKVGKPINPKYKTIADGSSVDPFLYRKPVVEEIFYTFNYNYQNITTVQEVEMKSAFASENGLSMLVAAQMRGLEAQFIAQLRSLKEEALNAAINDTNKPLNDTQVIEISISDAPTRDELVELVATVNNTVDAMTIQETGAFNRMNWEDLQDGSRLKFITRPTLKNTLKTKLMESAYNKEDLNLGIDTVVLQSFGGLVATKDGTASTALTPVYDSLGVRTSWTDSEGATVEDKDVKWYDPNADIIGIIADKGAIFELDQNAYSVYPVYNPAGLYTTYWASKPNGSVHYDPYRNFIVIKKASN